MEALHGYMESQDDIYDFEKVLWRNDEQYLIVEYRDESDPAEIHLRSNDGGINYKGVIISSAWDDEYPIDVVKWHSLQFNRWLLVGSYRLGACVVPCKIEIYPADE